VIRSSACLLLVSCIVAGCGASTYVPQRASGVVVVARGGADRYLRDGVEYSDLEDAVRSEPRAQEAARSYKLRENGGTWLAAAGLLIALGSTAIVVADASPRAAASFTGQSSNDSGSSGNQLGPIGYVAVGTAAAGIGCLLGGTLLVFSADARRWDAINIFNDRVSRAASPHLDSSRGVPSTSAKEVSDR